MGKKSKIKATDEAWDSRQLGSDENFVRVSKTSDELIDNSLGLKPISLRLQDSLIHDFKALAEFQGIGYQTLMRQVLKNFAENEKIRMANNLRRQLPNGAVEEELKTAL